MVITNAEHFVVANNLLFGLVKPKKSLDSQMKCLLVIQEKFENIVFHMFHNTLLCAHYGPLNTYVIGTSTGCIICLRNLRGVFPHVMLVAAETKTR